MKSRVVKTQPVIVLAMSVEESYGMRTVLSKIRDGESPDERDIRLKALRHVCHAVNEAADPDWR